jgi:hypothetical protein
VWGIPIVGRSLECVGDLFKEGGLIKVVDSQPSDPNTHISGSPSFSRNDESSTLSETSEQGA